MFRRRRKKKASPTPKAKYELTQLKRKLEPNEPVYEVTTYNLLAPDIGTPEEHSHCDPANLDPTTRIKRIKQKLHLQVEKESIICLQEIPKVWADELEIFLDKFTVCGNL